MESNRDEAKRCLRLALEAYRNESLDTAVLEKAKRLTRKSIRLYPSEEAEGKCLKTTPRPSVPNYTISFYIFDQKMFLLLNLQNS